MGQVSKPKILIVDDDPNVVEALSDFFCDSYEVVVAYSGEEAIKAVEEHPDTVAVLLDIRMPVMDGLETARRLRCLAADLPILFHTAYPGQYKEEEIDASEKPFEFLLKGESLTKLERAVRNAVEMCQLRRNVSARVDASEKDLRMVGRTPAMREVYEKVQKAALADAPVMILGPSGTGKELVARAIHRLSPRRAASFIAFPCNHKAADLVEAHLFGYVRGAFTGAVTDTIGLFEAADGGTVFLDEIGDLDITTQAKLLRVLEYGEYYPVGSAEIKTMSARILCATNKDLKEEVASGRFREDLYYRLNDIPIKLPLLRDRVEDVPLLINEFMRRYTIEKGRPLMHLTDEARDTLLGFNWPGNVRQLERAVRSLVLMTDSDIIDAEQVRTYLELPPVETEPETNSGNLLRQRLEAFERALIADQLRRYGGNIAAAGRALGVDRGNLRKRIIKLGLEDLSSDSLSN